MGTKVPLRFRATNGYHYHQHSRSLPRSQTMLPSLLSRISPLEIVIGTYLLIQSNFSNAEVDSIRTLTLSILPAIEKLVWNFDKRGRFIVTSAYYVACEWILPHPYLPLPPHLALWLLAYRMRFGRHVSLQKLEWQSGESCQTLFLRGPTSTNSYFRWIHYVFSAVRN